MAASDYAIIGLYLLTVLVVGSIFSRGQKTLREFFLGSKNIPWWAAAFSGIATIVSAIGYLGGPGQAFESDWTYLQARIAWPIAIVVTCVLFIPFFFKLEVYTAYEYLQKRFDLKTRVLTGVLFLWLKCFYAAIAIYAPALVVAEMTGFSFVWIVLGVGILTTAYTTMGGMRAVIWTDSIQLFVLLGGVIVALDTLLGRVDGGYQEVIAVAAAEGKLRVLDFSTSLTTEFTVWGGLIGGTFFLLSQYAVDQAELQRFLTTSSVKNSQRALVSTMVFTSIYGFLVFFIGSALYVFYLQNPDKQGLGILADRAFPKFIIEEFPAGLRGLLIAAVFSAAMSTVSSVLNSLATVTLRDLYQPLTRREGSVRFARWLTVVFGLVATGLSLYAGSLGNILVASGKVRNFFGGSLVGVFLLGMLVPSVNGSGAFIGVVIGFLGVAVLSALTSVSWMWYSAFSTLLCVVGGIVFSPLFKPPGEHQLNGLVWGRRDLPVSQEPDPAAGGSAPVSTDKTVGRR